MLSKQCSIVQGFDSLSKQNIWTWMTKNSFQNVFQQNIFQFFEPGFSIPGFDFNPFFDWLSKFTLFISISAELVYFPVCLSVLFSRLLLFLCLYLFFRPVLILQLKVSCLFAHFFFPYLCFFPSFSLYLSKSRLFIFSLCRTTTTLSAYIFLSGFVSLSYLFFFPKLVAKLRPETTFFTPIFFPD